jgi:hypothetical protein
LPNGFRGDELVTPTRGHRDRKSATQAGMRELHRRGRRSCEHSVSADDRD